jgi:hypothetical protein
MVGEGEWMMLRMHGHYQQNLLPFAGGLLDQPNHYLESMEIIEGARAKVNG